MLFVNLIVNNYTFGVYSIKWLVCITEIESVYCAVRTETLNVVQVWCVFVRASLHLRRQEKPTRCHWMVYCTYNMLNMFRALLCPSSGARDYMCVITAYGVQCLAADCRGQVQVSRLCFRNEGCCSTGCPVPDLQQPATKASHTIGGNNTHTISSSWWWA